MSVFKKLTMEVRIERYGAIQRLNWGEFTLRHRNIALSIAKEGNLKAGGSSLAGLEFTYKAREVMSEALDKIKDLIALLKK